MRFQAMFEGA